VINFGVLRKYILTGLLLWIPLGITILVVKLLVDLLDQSLILLPPPLRPESLIGFSLPGLGILISAIVLIVTGYLIIRFADRKLLEWGEMWLGRIPFVRSIYSASKQVTETILSADKNAFRDVYLIEYPRKGIWTFGFQTGNGIQEAKNYTKEDLITVFIPTTPNPTSGFIMLVPRGDAKKMDIDVEDALKLIVSLGVVTPNETKQTDTDLA
jgi:uncharacterized membrane protein